MEGRFKGRDIVNKPSCPFCGVYLDKPSELHRGTPQEMPVGACKCGAVYTCDVTGHNIGAAMVEALVFACNGDWDLAWDLLPDDDYLVAELNEYDFTSHLIVHSGAYEGRNVTGVLYFVKLHDDVLEVTEDGFRRKLEKKALNHVPSPDKKKIKSRLSKDEIEKLVA
ncbi:MAG: PBS lyase, partial [Deltaproteobacteria bacterium]|nr:PBS lyase [Deltaproteobacteria bacterium]